MTLIRTLIELVNKLLTSSSINALVGRLLKLALRRTVPHVPLEFVRRRAIVLHDDKLWSRRRNGADGAADCGKKLGSQYSQIVGGVHGLVLNVDELSHMS